MAVAAVVIVAVIAAGAAPSLASFGRSASVAQSVDAGTLQPPTSPVASPGECVKNKSTAVAVEWTPTASTFATGYEILRDDGGGGPLDVVGTAAGRSTARFVDTTVGFATTYRYQVRAVRNFWRSTATAPVSVTTPPKNCK